MNISRSKQIKVDTDIRSIIAEILKRNWSIQEWHENESDDEFQVGSYVGGFDGIEQEFWFSYYDTSGEEYWFGFSLELAKQITKEKEYYLDMQPAES